MVEQPPGRGEIPWSPQKVAKHYEPYPIIITCSRLPRSARNDKSPVFTLNFALQGIEYSSICGSWKVSRSCFVFLSIFKAFAVLLKNFRALILELQIIDKINFIYGENISIGFARGRDRLDSFHFARFPLEATSAFFLISHWRTSWVKRQPRSYVHPVAIIFPPYAFFPLLFICQLAWRVHKGLPAFADEFWRFAPPLPRHNFLKCWSRSTITGKEKRLIRWINILRVDQQFSNTISMKFFEFVFFFLPSFQISPKF